MAVTACTEANVLCELGEITNLYNFGLQLGIDSKVLDRIERDHRNDVERQRSEIIKSWYRNTADSERTWGRIADAIKKLGDHRNLETRLRQLGTTPGSTGPGTNLRIATTPGGASSPTAFSDALPPPELVSWLSQQFQAKGLTLDPSLGQKLMDNDINGEAFMDLKESDLVEMGFTKGQRMKIVKIIQSIKGNKEENSSSQNKAASKPVQIVKATSGAPVLSISTLTRLKGKDGKEVEIMKAVTPNWKAFGQLLDFDSVGRDLDTIDKRNRDPADSCNDMFQHWLKGNGIPATWSNVIDILDAIGLKVLAKDVKAISKNY